MIRRAIRAWIDRYGMPPSSADWSPSLLRQRSYSGFSAFRLEAFQEGWTDTDGTWRPFPSNLRTARLKSLVDELLAEDDELARRSQSPRKPIYVNLSDALSARSPSIRKRIVIAGEDHRFPVW
jgi:hypothetical protein